MRSKLAAIQQQLLGVFFEEAFEGLEVVESGLLRLDSGDAELGEVVDEIFRAAHSIKGAAGSFGLDVVMGVSHRLETLLDEVRAGTRAVDSGLIDLCLRSVDCLRNMVEAIQDDGELDEQRIAAMEKELDEAVGHASPVPEAEAAPAVEEVTTHDFSVTFKPQPTMLHSGNDAVRILREVHTLGKVDAKVNLEGFPGFHDLDPHTCYLSWELELRGVSGREVVEEAFAWVMDEAEVSIERREPPVPVAEPQKSPAAANQDGKPKSDSAEEPEESKRAATVSGSRAAASSIRIPVDKVDALLNMVGELVITQSMLGEVDPEAELDLKRLTQISEGLSQLARNTRELQETVMRIRSMPVSTVFNRFPRLVHDISRQLGKKVELDIQGESTELDKTVLEKLTDPLVHLVRNSLDHGLETPDIRREGGKPETGTLSLRAYHLGGSAVVEISDDGAGMNRDRILEKARERGLLEDGEQLTDQEVYELVFEAGFSTADEVSDISGRGVGMDVVRRNILALGGHISIDSQPGQGTTVKVRIPLTLAIIEGQLVRIGEITYVLPLISIVESLVVVENNITRVAGQEEAYRLRDELVPLVNLEDVLGIRPDSEQLSGNLLVVVEGEGRRVGIHVDELTSQQQVVIKSLERNYRTVPGLSGATILGDGSVAFILDVGGIVSAAEEHQRRILNGDTVDSASTPGSVAPAA